jgi:hypothetical protein
MGETVETASADFATCVLELALPVFSSAEFAGEEIIGLCDECRSPVQVVLQLVPRSKRRNLSADCATTLLNQSDNTAGLLRDLVQRSSAGGSDGVRAACESHATKLDEFVRLPFCLLELIGSTTVRLDMGWEAVWPQTCRAVSVKVDLVETYAQRIRGSAVAATVVEMQHAVAVSHDVDLLRGERFETETNSGSS